MAVYATCYMKQTGDRLTNATSATGQDQQSEHKHESMKSRFKAKKQESCECLRVHAGKSRRRPQTLASRPSVAPHGAHAHAGSLLPPWALPVANGGPSATLTCHCQIDRISRVARARPWSSVRLALYVRGIVRRMKAEHRDRSGTHSLATYVLTLVVRISS